MKIFNNTWGNYPTIKRISLEIIFDNISLICYNLGFYEQKNGHIEQKDNTIKSIIYPWHINTCVMILGNWYKVRCAVACIVSANVSYQETYLCTLHFTKDHDNYLVDKQFVQTITFDNGEIYFTEYIGLMDDGKIRINLEEGSIINFYGKDRKFIGYKIHDIRENKHLLYDELKDPVAKLFVIIDECL